ncbi:MAG: M15 family metallopeptidase [Pseudomonadota bacterium]
MVNEVDVSSVLGLTSDHIYFNCDERITSPIHHHIVSPFLALQADAKQAGFDLQIVSGFRDFERQLAIWTRKASGQRTLLDDRGEVLNFNALDSKALLAAIIRWSAIPGASRHHWGTDIDVFDASAVAPDYDVQLIPDEVNESGPFGRLHDWLDEQMKLGRAHGFFRPYAHDTGGIAPERWHLSYAPLSYQFQQSLSKEALFQVWEDVNLPLLSDIGDAWERIWTQFITIDDAVYPSIG